MAVKTLSERKEEEALLQEAVAGFREGTFGDNVSKCARTFGAKKLTLWRRINKKHDSHLKAHAASLYLTPGQEDALSTFTQYNASTGHATGVRTLRYTAQALAKKPIPPSKKWVRGYRERHPELVTGRSAPLDPKRAKAFNPTTVMKHFTLLKQFMEQTNILWSDCWNMDEKGIQIGGGRKNNGRKYFFSKASRSRYRLKDENLELVTVIECVSATGEYLPPGFIFAGKKHCPDWYKTEPCS